MFLLLLLVLWCLDDGFAVFWCVILFCDLFLLVVCLISFVCAC